MINFNNSVDFSERRPEEVMSFFWRSVYIRQPFIDPSFLFVIQSYYFWRVMTITFSIIYLSILFASYTIPE